LPTVRVMAKTVTTHLFVLKFICPSATIHVDTMDARNNMPGVAHCYLKRSP